MFSVLNPFSMFIRVFLSGMYSVCFCLFFIFLFPFFVFFSCLAIFFCFSLFLFVLLPHAIAASGCVISLLSSLSFVFLGSFVLFFLLVLLLLVWGSVLHLRLFLSCFPTGAFLCLASLSHPIDHFQDKFAF